MKARPNDALWGLLPWLVLLFVPGPAWGWAFGADVSCYLVVNGKPHVQVWHSTRRYSDLKGFLSIPEQRGGEVWWRKVPLHFNRILAHVPPPGWEWEWDTTYRLTVWNGGGDSPDGHIVTDECTTPPPPEPEPPSPPPEPEPPSPPPEPEPPSPPPEPEPPSPPPEPEPPSPPPEPEPDTPEPEACPAEPACDHIAIVPSMPRAMSGNEDAPDHWLRITNPHGESITVSVTGRDERGTKSGTYRRELPAYRSVKVKMRDIEAAFDATEPEGWWTLTVTAGGTVHVVPMMRHGDTRIVLPVARPGSCPGPGGVTRSR